MNSVRHIVVFFVTVSLIAASFVAGRSWDLPTKRSLQNQVELLTAKEERHMARLSRVFARAYPNPRLSIQLHSSGLPQPLRIYELQIDNRDATFGVAFNNLCLSAKEHGSDTEAWMAHAKVAASFNCRFVHSLKGVDYWCFRLRKGGELLSTIDGEYIADKGERVAFAYEGEEVTVFESPELSVKIGPSVPGMQEWSRAAGTKQVYIDRLDVFYSREL